jgi:CheY-like chemotaxis protein
MSVSILLVEDNEANLRARKKLLESFEDCSVVVGARDPDTAIHMLRSLPRFDLVVADIDLSQASKQRASHNKGGIAIARWLKDTRYPAFIAGYSSFFSGDELSQSERLAFDDIVDRAVLGKELDRKLATWISNAGNNSNSSNLRALLFEAYADSTSKKIERQVTVVSLDTLIDYEGDEVQDIRKNGFGLSLMLPDVDDQIRKAIPIWIKRELGAVYIEVVGQPYLFSEGGDENTAKEALRDLIMGYYNDLRDKDQEREMGSFVRLMFRFLEALFK